MQAGAIYRHDRFYADRETGELRVKYLLFLAPTRSGDWVARLLTSQQHSRPRVPPCFHGDPYPGYYLGIPGVPLDRETWVDLRPFDDVDVDLARMKIAKGILHEALQLEASTFRDVLACVAGAMDTTRSQETAIRDQLSSISH